MLKLEAAAIAVAAAGMPAPSLAAFRPLDDKQMSELREHGKRFNDGRYELFKSTMKYDGEIGRQQHDFPTIEKLPA